MTHVVTQACCADASCVFACPVNAIHPTPDEPDFGLAEMLYIDPKSCVDCGACVGACPVGAIVPDTKVSAEQLPFVDINALFHAEPRTYPIQAPIIPIVRKAPGPLHVAIVGSGPAALYAADELLKQSDVDVTVIDRLPTPHGLVRSGVAPDHVETKSIDRLFRQIEDQRGFHYLLNVDVGSDITHAELLEHCDAVIYATGASQDRRLGIPGEDLPGSETATEFVAWYNGHPDHAHHAVRPERRSCRHHRQRQRCARCCTHPVDRPGVARQHRHRRPRARGTAYEHRSRGRDRRPSRCRPGGVHAAGAGRAAVARRHRLRRRGSRPRRASR